MLLNKVLNKRGEVMKKYVAYYRVSTKQQGASGLGLDSQKETVNNFISKDDLIISEFTEIESGKNNKRVELQNAIEYAKKNDAILLIAKLDRLSRNANFIFQLRDNNVKFVCCDLPDANTLTIGIFAVLAQYERELISSRTVNALQQLKKNGVKLGTPENLTEQARANSISVRSINAKTNENNKRAMVVVDSLMQQNYSLRQIADRLNISGFKTSRNCEFTPMQVKRIYEMYSK